MASTTERIRIHYRRPPDREEVFDQRLVFRSEPGIVTFLERTDAGSPLRVDGDTILEQDSPIVWFTFPRAWYDIGRFHRAGGTFTGFYANLLTPVQFLDDSTWTTTDLFLDVWLSAGGALSLLDADELELAERSGWVDAATAGRARAEAERILTAAGAGEWPPPIVHEWTLERVLSTIDEACEAPARRPGCSPQPK